MDTDTLPRHVAIIMDGNGRWARRRFMPRVAGHKAGIDVVREVVRQSAERKIEVLTLWAFSSENWKRSADEVTFLMSLFRMALEREVSKLHENNIRLTIMGDRSPFDAKLCEQIQAAETLTSQNTGLHLVVAFNYGGRWDIAQAVSRLMKDAAVSGKTDYDLSEISAGIQQRLCLAALPEPDLLIRTSGEKRISNFYLWQLAYTEFYFTDVLWPDFTAEEFDRALVFYASRERRFGATEGVTQCLKRKEQLFAE